jgi:3-oxoacyl-[acyl-carrier-protein] synthase-3
MKAQIRDIGVSFPEAFVTNQDLREQNADWNLDLVQKRSGVYGRYVAAADETALDLSCRACRDLFERSSDLPETIDALIFCTQSADYIMPPNACVLHKSLGLSERVMAFDVNLACSGFVYLLALAQSLVVSGMVENLLLVTADTYSKYIHRGDRSARVLFGDAAAATWVAADDTGRGIRDVLCGTAGQYFDKFIIPAGGCRIPKSSATSLARTDDSGNTRSDENIHMAGRDILAFVNSRIPKNVRELLNRNALEMGDVDQFFFHQASSMILDSLTRLLRLKDDQVFRNLKNIGNTVSASLPIAIKEALDTGAISRNDTLVLCGFGVGLSWGSVLLDF